MRLGKLRRLGLVLVVLALFTAGCAGGEDEGGGGTDQAAGEPVTGGTLRIVNETDVDYWDTGSAYTVNAWTFARLYVRTLYNWDGTKPPEEATDPVPDIAAGPPTVSDDRLTYTFKLRPDVKYAPPVDRAVKADDFIYAVERQYNKQFPSPNPYNTVIKGVKEFSEGKADTISGMKAVDDTTSGDHPRPAGQRLPVDHGDQLLRPGPRGVRLQVQAADRLLQGLPRRRPLLPRELDAEQVGHLRPQPQLGRGQRPPAQGVCRQGRGALRGRPERRPAADRVGRRRPVGRQRAAIAGPAAAVHRPHPLQAVHRPGRRLHPVPDAADRQRPDRQAGGPPGDQLRGRQAGDRPGGRRQDRRRPVDHGPHPAAGRLPEVRPVPHARQSRRPRQGQGAAHPGRVPERRDRDHGLPELRRGAEDPHLPAGVAGTGRHQDQEQALHLPGRLHRLAPADLEGGRAPDRAGRVVPGLAGQRRPHLHGRAAGRAQDHPAGQQQLRQLQQRQDQPAHRPGAHRGRQERRRGGLGRGRQAGDDRRGLGAAHL